jgi:transposase-like protein
VLGVAAGPSEAEPFWKAFLRSLADRGLLGVKLVIADDHKGLRAAAGKVFAAGQQRCRVHWMRNALAHAAPNPLERVNKNSSEGPTSSASSQMTRL